MDPGHWSLLSTLRDHAIVFGTGENFRFLRQLNADLGLFEQLHPIEHPRFIMQYRRRKLNDYLDRYSDVFSRTLESVERRLKPRAAAGSS